MTRRTIIDACLVAVFGALLVLGLVMVSVAFVNAPSDAFPFVYASAMLGLAVGAATALLVIRILINGGRR